MFDSFFKTCNKCGETKPLRLFTKGNKGAIRNPCKKCSSGYQTFLMSRRTPEYRRKVAEGDAVRRAGRLKAVFDHYGHSCECCGESEPKFMTIDHIEPCGTKNRNEMKQRQIYFWLIQNNFPPGFRVLCSNCNHGRHRNGGICPHQMGSQTIAQASRGKCPEVPEAPQRGQDIVETAGKPVAEFVDIHDNSLWPLTSRIQ